MSQDQILHHNYVGFATEAKKKKFSFFPHQFADSSSAHWEPECVPQNRWHVLCWVYFGAVLDDAHAELHKTCHLKNEKLILATNIGNEKFTPY